MEILEIKDGDCLLVKSDIDCDYQLIRENLKNFITGMGFQNVHCLILPNYIQVDILRPKVQTKRFI